MSDTNDQYDLRSFASKQGDVRSMANEQPGLSNANEQSDQPAVASVQHGQFDQSERTYWKLVHSRKGHKTCFSKTCLPISLAVIRETLTSISEKCRLIKDAEPDKCLKTELETACEFRAEVRDFNQQTIDLLENQLESSRGTTNEANELQTMLSPRSSQIKLPKINLPSFTGKYTEWTSFIDHFDSAVHENPNLRDADKMDYFKSSLRGEAHDLVKNVAKTDVNYDRFDDKIFIVKTHLSVMLLHPNLKSVFANTWLH